MKLLKTATSGALIAALSLSVGCASKPDTQEIVEEPSQGTAAISSDARNAESTLDDQSPQAASGSVPLDSPVDKSELKAESNLKVESQRDEQPSKLASKADSEPKAATTTVAVSTAKPEAVKAEKSAPAKPAKTEKVVEVKAPSNEKASKKSLKNALDISNKDLPVTLDLWTLRKSVQPGEGLVLSTPTLQMGDGDYLSQIRLILTPDHLVIDSSSDIDTNLKGIGVRYNGSDIIPLDRMVSSTVGIVEGDWMSRFAAGGTLEILLGFFPDKSEDSPVFKKTASMSALSKLVPTYYKLQ